MFVIGAAQLVTEASWNSSSTLKDKTYLWGLLLLGWKSIHSTVLTGSIFPF